MRKWTSYMILLIGLWGCKEKYVAEVVSTDKNLLVVEGFINVGSNAITSIVLSRTAELSNHNNLYETKAKLEIQAKSGAVYALIEGSNGTYKSAALNLPVSDSYRLHILTSNGKEYVSEYAAAKTTPDIKGISTEKLPDGSLRLYSDSKITASDSRYYQWKIEETWEFHSPLESRFTFTKNTAGLIVDAAPTIGNVVNQSIKTCWTTQSPGNIMLGNLERFTTDSIHELLTTIPAGSQKLSVLYSINIKQYALSHPAYLFLDAMRKNTEQLGTVFDAQPSNLNSNVHSLSSPSEQVVGFVDVTQEKVRRFFISPSNIAGGWSYMPVCTQMSVDSVGPVSTDLVRFSGYLPLHFNDIDTAHPSWIRADFGTSTCVDCTLTGVNVKPPFWP